MRRGNDQILNLDSKPMGQQATGRKRKRPQPLSRSGSQIDEKTQPIKQTGNKKRPQSLKSNHDKPTINRKSTSRKPYKSSSYNSSIRGSNYSSNRTRNKRKNNRPSRRS